MCSAVHMWQRHLQRHPQRLPAARERPEDHVGIDTHDSSPPSGCWRHSAPKIGRRRRKSWSLLPPARHPTTGPGGHRYVRFLCGLGSLATLTRGESVGGVSAGGLAHRARPARSSTSQEFVRDLPLDALSSRSTDDVAHTLARRSMFGARRAPLDRIGMSNIGVLGKTRAAAGRAPTVCLSGSASFRRPSPRPPPFCPNFSPTPGNPHLIGTRPYFTDTHTYTHLHTHTFTHVHSRAHAHTCTQNPSPGLVRQLLRRASV